MRIENRGSDMYLNTEIKKMQIVMIPALVLDLVLFFLSIYLIAGHIRTSRVVWLLATAAFPFYALYYLYRFEQRKIDASVDFAREYSKFEHRITEPVTFDRIQRVLEKERFSFIKENGVISARRGNAGFLFFTPDPGRNTRSEEEEAADSERFLDVFVKFTTRVQWGVICYLVPEDINEKIIEDCRSGFAGKVTKLFNLRRFMTVAYDSDNGILYYADAVTRVIDRKTDMQSTLGTLVEKMFGL